MNTLPPAGAFGGNLDQEMNRGVAQETCVVGGAYKGDIEGSGKEDSGEDDVNGEECTCEELYIGEIFVEDSVGAVGEAPVDSADNGKATLDFPAGDLLASSTERTLDPPLEAPADSGNCVAIDGKDEQDHHHHKALKRPSRVHSAASLVSLLKIQTICEDDELQDAAFDQQLDDVQNSAGMYEDMMIMDDLSEFTDDDDAIVSHRTDHFDAPPQNTGYCQESKQDCNSSQQRTKGGTKSFLPGLVAHRRSTVGSGGDSSTFFLQSVKSYDITHVSDAYDSADEGSFCPPADQCPAEADSVADVDPKQTTTILPVDSHNQIPDPDLDDHSSFLTIELKTSIAPSIQPVDKNCSSVADTPQTNPILESTTKETQDQNNTTIHHEIEANKLWKLRKIEILLLIVLVKIVFWVHFTKTSPCSSLSSLSRSLRFVIGKSFMHSPSQLQPDIHNLSSNFTNSSSADTTNLTITPPSDTNSHKRQKKQSSNATITPCLHGRCQYFPRPNRLWGTTLPRNNLPSINKHFNNSSKRQQIFWEACMSKENKIYADISKVASKRLKEFAFCVFDPAEYKNHTGQYKSYQ